MASVFSPMGVSAITASRRRAEAPSESKVGSENQMKMSATSAAAMIRVNDGVTGRFSLLPTNSSNFAFKNFKLPTLALPFGLPKPDHNDIFRHYQVLACFAP